jgi:tetratricopeptide (TPR) repeat protein
LILIASCVNLHHFVLDGAIWKLRDGRIARILLRGEAADQTAPLQPPAFGWSRALTWGLGAICAVQFTAYTLEQEFGVRRATESGDTARLEKAAQHLAWIGLETPNAALNQGILHAQRGQFPEARRSLQLSLEIHPTATAYTALGQVYAREGKLSASLTALESALELDPQNTTALHQMGANWLELGQPGEAVKALTRARSSADGQPGSHEIDRLLERARHEANEAG